MLRLTLTIVWITSSETPAVIHHAVWIVFKVFFEDFEQRCSGEYFDWLPSVELDRSVLLGKVEVVPQYVRFVVLNQLLQVLQRVWLIVLVLW